MISFLIKAKASVDDEKRKQLENKIIQTFGTSFGPKTR